ncbi:hypothetical protein [Nocardia wallacei]|uniref:hypothetical protein n=1 Tax=Nocardia wallacei TaxID=480035 RepID=UPI0024557939|nr:hypothetical protein [Nocardia wallacei]
MPYIHITRSPGVGLREYRIVHQALGPEPIAGNLLSIVGESDGALHVVDLWESAAAADRFAAERLFPAFARTGIRPGPGETVTAFDAEVVIEHRRG